LKLAWPFGLGSWPKVYHDADDADCVPEGAQGSGAVRTTQPATISNGPRPTFQIFVMRNVNRRGYRSPPRVEE
jgi:hypothetical protein